MIFLQRDISHHRLTVIDCQDIDSFHVEYKRITAKFLKLCIYLTDILPGQTCLFPVLFSKVKSKSLITNGHGSPQKEHCFIFRIVCSRQDSIILTHLHATFCVFSINEETLIYLTYSWKYYKSGQQKFYNESELIEKINLHH